MVGLTRTLSIARRRARSAGGDPAWARPALVALLAGTAVLYTWRLGASEWANSFYSAAVQAGASSWTAFFFGSSDAAGAITVDKTPAALWPMAISARLFGLNSWSILMPQAVMGVATVATVYAAVRRALAGTVPARVEAGAGLLAGAVLALTPVATLMFRFNNPDALLVLMLTVAAYALVRAQAEASTRWLVVCGACVGAGFLAKMMQAFLVLPAFGLVYLLAAPTPLRRRIWQSALAAAAMLAAAGWWVAIVALVPADARPYIGGTQGNSVLELALGYNGLGRLNGDEVGGLGNTDDDAGWGRLFGYATGGQISWLLPAALVLLVIGSWTLRSASRTDRVRASLGLWGGWLLVTGVVFSLMQGIFHQYYTVALAPAVAALAGLGTGLLWPRRRTVAGAATLAAVVAVTAAWSCAVLQRTPDWHPWLGPVVAVGGLVTAGVLLRAAYLPERVVAAAAVAVSLAGPAAYAQDTIASPRSGVIVTAGPSLASGAGLMRTGAGGGKQQDGTARQDRSGQPARGGREVLMRSSPPPSAELVALLNANADSYRWPAATLTSLNAAVYQLATRTPVMAIGGFNGTDPAPTLERFQQYVAHQQIHYFVDGGGMSSAGDGRPHGGSDAGRRIAEWVKTNFTVRTVGTAKVYDLTTPT
ncbi:glycosyltransferase family 39 protein [Nonomuraea sp. MG754425]|uniref:ArnT family glycosyltransferase n=1 Tax=Nonomuraea sp. MG754425 TaxID=2570319 RepID=UPI001F41EC48|nr:glycosyltransferase family 39 protein [Nonomuraea sp. MG754425]MCF6475303.1 glycosyltransferase family 39 protein [Nonomuraea sp. MG754425]